MADDRHATCHVLWNTFAAHLHGAGRELRRHASGLCCPVVVLIGPLHVYWHALAACIHVAEPQQRLRIARGRDLQIERTGSLRIGRARFDAADQVDGHDDGVNRVATGTTLRLLVEAGGGAHPVRIDRAITQHVGEFHIGMLKAQRLLRRLLGGGTCVPDRRSDQQTGAGGERGAERQLQATHSADPPII